MLASRLKAVGPLGLALLAGCLAPAAARANHVSGEAFVRIDGSQVRVVVQLEIEGGWHLYHTEPGGDLDQSGEGYPARPLVVLPGGEGVRWAKPVLPEATRYEDEILENWVNVHTGRIRVYLAGELVDGRDGSDIVVTLSGATCSTAGACLRYEEVLEPKRGGPPDLFADFPPTLRFGSD